MKINDKVFEPVDLYEVTGGMTPAEIGGAVENAKTVPRASGKLLSKLKQNLYDCCVFVFSDSTGNSQSEWVYKYGEWLASLYPTHTVEYYLWDDSTDLYESAVTIQSGTGSRTLSIYNGAVPGSRPAHLMGDKYPSAVLSIPDADLVFCNHGHNILGYLGSDSENIQSGRVPLMIEPFAQILTRHDGAGVVILGQNPRRDDDDYAPQYIANNEAAGLINADFADSYSLFMDRDKDSSLYIDSIHPSDEGTALYLEAVKRLHNSYAHKPAVNPLKSSRNLVDNGDFSAFGGVLPDSWAAVNCTAEKDTVIYESPNGYSVQLSKTTGGSQSYLTQSLSNAQKAGLRGQYLTFAIRCYIESGQAATVGRVALTTNSKSSNSYPIVNDARDGWHWRMVSLYFSPSDSYLFARIFVDTGNEASASIRVDRAILCRGRLPSDVL